MSLLQNEPVRALIYSLYTAVLLFLVASDVITDAQSVTVAGVVTALTALVTETARSKVTPVLPAA